MGLQWPGWRRYEGAETARGKRGIGGSSSPLGTSGCGVGEKDTIVLKLVFLPKLPGVAGVAGEVDGGVGGALSEEEEEEKLSI